MDEAAILLLLIPFFVGFISFILAITFMIISIVKYSSAKQKAVQNTRCNYCGNFLFPGNSHCNYCGQFYMPSPQTDISIKRDRKLGKAFMIWSIITGILTVVCVVLYFVSIFYVASKPYEDLFNDYDNDYYNDFFDDYEDYHNDYDFFDEFTRNSNIISTK
jgi:hypothetical protein